MSSRITVGLLSHQLVDGNLGCCALSYSNIAILDECIKQIGKTPHYVFIVTDKTPQIEPAFVESTYEYRFFPSCMQTAKNPSRLARCKCFDGCDIVFNLCGGDGYTDIYGFPRLLAESYMTLFARTKGVPVVFSPQTIGPFSRMPSRIIAKRTLSGLKRLFVRDGRSMTCCDDLDLAVPRSEVIDVAFALPYRRCGDKSGDVVRVGVNVSGLLFNGGYNGKNYFDLNIDYAVFTRKLLAELSLIEGVEIHFVPHVLHDNPVEDDYEVCRKLQVEFPGTVLAPRFTTPMEAKSYISTMDFFVGARMHATIAASSSGVPVVPVAYSRKVNGLYETLKYPYYIDAKTIENESEATSRVIEWFRQREMLSRRLNGARRIYEDRLDVYRNEMCQVFEAL